MIRRGIAWPGVYADQFSSTKAELWYEEYAEALVAAKFCIVADQEEYA
jgi:hypothetical protein